jgi:hypothetical protein
LRGINSVSNIVITRGTFLARRVDGAEIGSNYGSSMLTLPRAQPDIGPGLADNGNSTVRKIVIEDGVYDCVGDNGPAIGSGCSSSGLSSIDTLLISDGDFLVESESGAGIGSRSADNGISSIPNLTTMKGHFLAFIFSFGAGIGTGDGLANSQFLGI